MASGELAAALGLAGLDDHGMNLRRPRHVQRAAAAVVLALEAQLVDLLGIDEQPAGPVEHERIRVPALPQPVAQLHVLLGHGVALIVRDRRVTEVLRQAPVSRGHDVPADAPLGQMIDRIEHPGRRPRVELDRAQRDHDAEGGRGGGGDRGQRRGVELDALRAEPQRLARAVDVRVEDAANVADEQRVEAHGFEQPRLLGPDRRLGLAVASPGHVLRVAPCLGVVVHERRET